MKRFLKVILIVVGILAVVAGSLAAFVLLGKSQTLDQSVGTISLNEKADGTYDGSYSGFRWSNEVKVQVADHRIVDIQVAKPQVFATTQTIDAIKQRVLDAQSLDVDVISGATVDSKAFLKAVENALK